MAVCIIALIAVIGIPFTANTFAMFRIGGDARMILNAVSVAKMRAAASFTQARIYIDVPARTHHLEVLQKGAVPAWVADGGTKALAMGDNYGFGPALVPPPNTTAAIAQAPPCRAIDGTVIANTACIIFNSRGVPVDPAGAPTGVGAIYLTDGVTLYGVTLSATGQLRLWRGLSAGQPTWVQQ